MIKSFLCLFLLSGSILFAGNLPWIGVSLKCLDSGAAVSASLPEGAGLKVRHVVEGGPLEKAGGLKGDIWWKFDDQLLVNRGQLVVLLRGKNPGDEVSVEFYRSGKSQVISLKLGKWPESEMTLVSNKRAAEVPPHQSRRLESSKQTASLSVNGEQLTLEKTVNGWGFEVLKDGKVLFEKDLTGSNISSSLESRWMEPFMILQLTLAQKMPNGEGEKKARVRYISRKPESKETN